ncbi:MAG: UTP--glucose-1-phosphate uridylyltransferase [Planctomycetota bacterium]
MAIDLLDIIRSSDDAVRHQSLESIASGLDAAALLGHASQLDAYRRDESNLYARVRALFFLSAIYRVHVPTALETQSRSDPSSEVGGLIPHEGYDHLLARRFTEAIDVFLQHQTKHGVSDAISSALAQAYHQLGFQTLADQVRRSVRTVRGNQWMFRLGHPDDHPLRFRSELLTPDTSTGVRPLLCESTAVRMDLSHSAWSDIFFLGMDFPAGARVLNISVDLGVRGRDDCPMPPIETYLRVIDEPVFRLASVDLGATAEIHTIGEMFDFARDYLGLLKAAVIAAGIVPPGLEGCGRPIKELLDRIVAPGKGLELVSKINDIPKGSRLAVSTNLLGSLISILMRATGQVQTLVGGLSETERRLVGARAILGEWIGGSGGGWQDSGGVWPGIKLICGAEANEGDPEFNVSRGRLMPEHEVLSENRVSEASREKLRQSLVLVHGGMAQNVGPILEMVTERYLLRSDKEWKGRQEAIKILDEVVSALEAGDIHALGRATTKNFEGPLQTIIPWATNRFTDRVIEACREKFGDQFWGFVMLGGMSGGGMGFLFDPRIKTTASDWLQTEMVQIKSELQTSLPFAMDPVVYDFSINDRGSWSTMKSGEEAMMPDRYYQLALPKLLQTPLRDLSADRRADLQAISRRASQAGQSYEDKGVPIRLLQSVLPDQRHESEGGQSLRDLLKQIGFDSEQHEQIRSDMLNGRIGLSQNRLSPSTTITDVAPNHVHDLRQGCSAEEVALGEQSIREGHVGVVTLAAGVGSRWTEGAGVCKALHPFNRFAGRHRSFLEVHLAKNRRIRRAYDCVIPHVFTTSYLTDQALRDSLDRHDRFGFDSSVYVSTGKSVGLRMVPTLRDLQFLWQETSEQVLDQQQQKVRESVRAALMNWARSTGEATDYTDNVPNQCLHPVGHWYEVPNLLRNGQLAKMLGDQPSLRYLMLHNIDTLCASIDPGMLGRHIRGGAALTFEVITRRLEDRGGGLALVDGRPRLVEGLAMPDEEIEFDLTYYNSMTTWIEIDALLSTFGLTRAQLSDQTLVDSAVRRLARRLPTYITLKDVKKRWGHAQEDVFPVAQFEKLWGDMTSLPGLESQFLVVPIRRGQQLKSQAQLDPWKRDGSADYIDGLCDWTQ